MGGLLLAAARTRSGLAPGVRVERGDDGTVVVRGRGTRAASLGVPERRRVALLDALAATDGVPAGALDDLLAAPADRYFAMQLAARGFLGEHLVDDDGRAVAHLAVGVLPDEPIAVPARVQLAPDVFVRVDDGDLVVESATQADRHDVIDPSFAGVLLSFSRPVEAGESVAPDAWLAALVRAGLLVDAADAEHAAATPATTPVARWEFHDQLFHTRTRLWLGAARPYGATYRLRDRMEPLPARAGPPSAAGPAIALERPDLASRAASDPSVTDAMESRRSRREFGARFDSRDLGELLYRVARVRGVREHTNGEEVDRPIPAGGALHELELYPLVVSCDGLDPGLFHYDAFDHALRRVELCTTPVADAIAAVARDTAGVARDASVHVCLLAAARFGRLQVKYSSMAYAAVLKNVGVLYEAVYLCGEAMGLAVCALGGGDAGLFARATGADPFEESTVGELLIGARAHGGSDRGD